MAGNAEPDVSIRIREGDWVVVSSERADERDPTRLQQMQPLRSSVTVLIEEEVASWESIARSPNSFFRRASL